jgi:hypothetical protein
MAGQESRIAVAASQPMSVEQIVQKAADFDYNPLISLKSWLRTAKTLLQEVKDPPAAVAFAMLISHLSRLRFTNKKAMTNKRISYSSDMLSLWLRTL